MTDFWNDFPSVKNGLAAVVSTISDTLRTDNFPLAQALEGLVDADGKMLRPGFLLLSSEFGHPDRDRLIPLAAAIEILHIATLIHDDILDDAPLRRGKTAFHILNGTKEALLTGDWLFSRCFLLAADFTTPENARNLSHVIGIICSSEIKQDLDKFKYSKSLRDYLQKIAGKTAVLFSLALTVGADESACNPRVVSHLRRAGYNIGMAFQVIDDILDYESTEDVIRKPIGKDLAEGLCTLPLINALARDDGKITRLLSNPPFSQETILQIVHLVRESGSLEESRKTAQRYTERALLEIDKLPNNPARETLRKVTERLLTREY